MRAVDLNLPPGVESDMGEGDDWPGVRERVLSSEILIMASPTWLGRPSSVAQRVLERMDANLAGTAKGPGRQPAGPATLLKRPAVRSGRAGPVRRAAPVRSRAGRERGPGRPGPAGHR